MYLVLILRSMRVFVKTLTGKTIVIGTDPEETVLDVKCKITEQEGFPADRQRMVFAGNQLEDSRTLSDCLIVHDATIYMTLE